MQIHVVKFEKLNDHFDKVSSVIITFISYLRVRVVNYDLLSSVSSPNCLLVLLLR